MRSLILSLVVFFVVGPLAAQPAMSFKELQSHAERVQFRLDGISPKEDRVKEEEPSKSDFIPMNPSEILFECIEFGPEVVQLRFDF